jgi:sensor histidine kinase YesM
MLNSMAFLKYSKAERWIAFLLLPPVAVVLNISMFGQRYFQSFWGFLLATVITLAVVFLIYITCGMVGVIFMNKYSKYSQTFRRIALSLLTYVLIMVAGISLLFFGYDYLGFMDFTINYSNYFWTLMIGLAANFLATSFNEGAAFYMKWRSLVDEAEQLKKENLQSQLEGLKGQVNPHFLFNSLNSLSSLISEDPAKAEKFLDEMSKVYRYMLRTNEDGLTTLETELQFIQSYFHLLKTRYNDGLEMELKIDEKLLHYLIPPLTLQILVENAVKHNMILRDSPLVIQLMTTNSRKLVVTNNLQRKKRMVFSNKVGLNNIHNKYRLMKQEEIMIRDDGKEFSVVVPLIQP